MGKYKRKGIRKETNFAKRMEILKFIAKKTGVAPKIDGLYSCATNKIQIDLFDLEKRIPNYNWYECTYKGKPNYSINMAIEEEWGKEIADMIKSLL